MADQETFPIWKDSYEKIGVSPHELYMRQNGLCWIVTKVFNDTPTLYCTDGKDKAQTKCMLNPTVECMGCVSEFTELVFSGKIKSSEQENWKNNISNNP